MIYVFTECTWFFYTLCNKKAIMNVWGDNYDQTFTWIKLSQLNCPSLLIRKLPLYTPGLTSHLHTGLWNIPCRSPGICLFAVWLISSCAFVPSDWADSVEGHYHHHHHEQGSPSVLGQSYAVCPGMCVLCSGTWECLAFSVSLPNAWRR